MSDGCGSSEYLQLCLLLSVMVFFFKQKTAYEMGISDWSSDVCSSDLSVVGSLGGTVGSLGGVVGSVGIVPGSAGRVVAVGSVGTGWPGVVMSSPAGGVSCASAGKPTAAAPIKRLCFHIGNLLISGESRSEEHTSELQSLIRLSYAVFC